MQKIRYNQTTVESGGGEKLHTAESVCGSVRIQKIDTLVSDWGQDQRWERGSWTIVATDRWGKKQRLTGLEFDTLTGAKKAVRLIGELERLNELLGRYRHRWSEDPSFRMQNWLTTYEDLRINEPTVWANFCLLYNHSLDHNAGDVLA